MDTRDARVRKVSRRKQTSDSERDYQGGKCVEKLASKESGKVVKERFLLRTGEGEINVFKPSQHYLVRQCLDVTPLATP